MLSPIEGKPSFNLFELRKGLEEKNIKTSPAEIIDGVHSMIVSPQSSFTDNELQELKQIVNYLTPGAEGLSLKKIQEIRSICFDPYPERGILVGVGVVTERETGNPVQIEIRKVSSSGGRYGGRYKAYHGDEVLGSVGIYKFVKTEKGYGADTDRTDTCYALYGSFIPDLSIKIMVEDLKASKNKKYRGIGTELMQLAYEISKAEGGRGKLVFDSSYASGGFYYKLGFRVLDPDPFKCGTADRAIAQNVKAGKRWEGSTPMYLPRSSMGEWETKVKDKPILFSGSGPPQEVNFSSIFEVIDRYDSENDYFHSLQEWSQKSSEEVLKKGVEASLMQASQGNLTPLYALLQLIPEALLLSLIFELFPQSDTVNHLFVQALQQRITDQFIPEIIFHSPLVVEQKKELFKLYLSKSYSLDLEKVDEEGNNIFHYFCRYLSDPFKGRGLLVLRCVTLENLNAKNKRGETPAMVATGSLAEYVRNIEENPDDFF